jgi:hypothetical protein
LSSDSFAPEKSIFNGKNSLKSIISGIAKILIYIKIIHSGRELKYWLPILDIHPEKSGGNGKSRR